MYCNNCGNQLEENATVCSQCGAQTVTQAATEATPEKQSFSLKLKALMKKRRFWIIAAAVLVVLIIIITASGNGTPSDLIDLPEAEYRAQCQTYSYSDIARNPDQYEKKLAKFRGEVIQVLKDGNQLQMRVDVTYNGYIYTDTVFVFYNTENGTNVIEGDIIDMYGELRGMQEYESVLGAQISIPRIYVKYIDLVK